MVLGVFFFFKSQDFNEVQMEAHSLVLKKKEEGRD
jgi:hypothetical protein